jgi:hypothetical protein
MAIKVRLSPDPAFSRHQFITKPHSRMKLLIIDTETCTDSNESSPCEVSATLYQVDENPRKTGAIASVSTILLVTDNQAEAVNGITPELTNRTRMH